MARIGHPAPVAMVVICAMLALPRPAAADPFAHGDVDDSGQIDIADVLLAMRIATGHEAAPAPEALVAADVAPPALSGPFQPDGVDMADVQLLLQAVSGVDVDGDRLDVAWELTLGNSPFTQDSDGDGIDDGSEDSDGDGLADADEIVANLDPLVPEFSVVAVPPPDPNNPPNPRDLVVTSAPGWTDFTVVVNGVNQHEIWPEQPTGGSNEWTLRAALFDGSNDIWVEMRQDSAPAGPRARVQVGPPGLTWAHQPEPLSSRTITGDVVVEPAGGSETMGVTGDITVAAGGVLVILAGQTLSIDGGVAIDVSGQLHVLGSDATAAVLAASGSGWDGIDIQPGAHLELREVDISDLHQPIEVGSASGSAAMSATDLRISDYGSGGNPGAHSGRAIVVEVGSVAELSQLDVQTVSSSSGNVVRWEAGSAGFVTDSRLTNDGGGHGAAAITLLDADAVLVARNEIGGQWGSGVRVEGGTPTIESNAFSPDLGLGLDRLFHGVRVLPATSTAFPIIRGNTFERVHVGQGPNNICNSTGARTGIVVEAGAGADVHDNTIETDGSSDKHGCGIKLEGVTDSPPTQTTVRDNTIRGFHSGIWISDSDPLIEGNSVWGSARALRLRNNADPDARENALEGSEYGVQVVGGSVGQFSSNYISGNEVGIVLSGGATAVGGAGIDGNIITLNGTGVRVETGSDVVISFNHIELNLDANLHFTVSPGSVDISLNFWRDPPPTTLAEAGIVVDSGTLAFPTVLNAFDDEPLILAVAAVGLAEQIVGGSSIPLDAVQFPSRWNPWADGPLGIYFPIVAVPTTVTLRICRELGLGSCPAGSAAAVVEHMSSYTTSGEFGIQSISWAPIADGSIPDEAYAVVIEVSTPTGATMYDFARTAVQNANVEIADVTTVASTANAHRNEYYKFIIHNPKLRVVRSKLEIRTGTSPRHSGSHALFGASGEADDSRNVYWNGRHLSGSEQGAIDELPGNIHASDFVGVKPNHVRIEGGTPEIARGAWPDIEIKSDPNVVFDSYDQVARIKLEVSLDSQVTVRLLESGAIAGALVLGSESVAASAGQEFDVTLRPWFTDDGNELTVEGTLSFEVIAVADVSGVESRYLGSLQVFH